MRSELLAENLVEGWQVGEGGGRGFARGLQEDQGVGGDLLGAIGGCGHRLHWGVFGELSRGGGPGEGRDAGGTGAEHGHAAVGGEGEGVELKSAGVGQTCNHDDGFFPGEFSGGCDGFVEGADFPQNAFSPSGLRGLPDQSGVDDKEIPAAVELQEFNGAEDEVRQTWLAGLAGAVFGKGEGVIGKDPEYFRFTPGGGVVEFFLGAHDIKAELPGGEEQVASILPRAALFGGDKLRGAAAEEDIGRGFFQKAAADGVRVIDFTTCGEERGGGGLGKRGVGDEAGGASLLLGQFQERAEHLSFGGDGERAAVHGLSGGKGRGGGGGVRHGVVAGLGR